MSGPPPPRRARCPWSPRLSGTLTLGDASGLGQGLRPRPHPSPAQSPGRAPLTRPRACRSGRRGQFARSRWQFARSRPPPPCVLGGSGAGRGGRGGAGAGPHSGPRPAQSARGPDARRGPGAPHQGPGPAKTRQTPGARPRRGGAGAAQRRSVSESPGGGSAGGCSPSYSPSRAQGCCLQSRSRPQPPPRREPPPRLILGTARSSPGEI